MKYKAIPFVVFISVISSPSFAKKPDIIKGNNGKSYVQHDEVPNELQGNRYGVDAELRDAELDIFIKNSKIKFKKEKGNKGFNSELTVSGEDI